MYGRLRRGLAHRWLDAAAVLSLAAISIVTASRYVNEHFALSYDSPYRDCTEDLLYPCVGALGRTIDQAALDASPHWQAFVAGRIDALSCDTLRRLPRVDAGHLSAIQRYLHASLSAIFALTGPRRSTYVGYMTVMFVITVLAAYALARLGSGPLIASIVTLPFIFSDLHLRSALHPAEYVKAPFFLWCLGLLGVIVMRDTGRRGLIALSVGAGLIAGVGIGFKTDVLICIPIGIAAVAAFAPRSVSALRRVVAVAAFVVAILVSAWPVLQTQFSGEWGSLLPVQVLGGMDRSFADYYAEPSLYDYGIRFDDSHITYVINSYDQRVNGATGFAQFYSKQLQRSATQLVADIDRTFPADFLLRSVAAVVNVLKLARFGLLAATIVLPLLLIRDPRVGAAVAFFLCTAIGYTSLVFQPKHFFHLEWVPWWFIAVALQQLVTGPRGVPIRGHGGRIAALAAVAVAIGGVMMVARWYQESRVTTIAADSLAHARDQRLTTVEMVAPDGARRLTIAPHELGAAPHPTPLAVDYLAFQVECRSHENGTITAVYEQATSPREPMVVPCARGPRVWTLFWPVYQYQPASRLLWFESAGTSPVEIRSIYRVADLRPFRTLLKLAIPDGDARQRWYHVLRASFLVDPVGPPRHS